MKAAFAIFMLNVYEASAPHVLMTNHEVIYIANFYRFRDGGKNGFNGRKVEKSNR